MMGESRPIFLLGIAQFLGGSDGKAAPLLGKSTFLPPLTSPWHRPGPRQWWRRWPRSQASPDCRRSANTPTTKPLTRDPPKTAFVSDFPTFFTIQLQAGYPEYHTGTESGRIPTYKRPDIRSFQVQIKT